MQRLIDYGTLGPKSTIYITASSKGKNHCQQGSVNCIRTIYVVYLQRKIWAWKGSFTYEHMQQQAWNVCITKSCHWEESLDTKTLSVGMLQMVTVSFLDRKSWVHSIRRSKCQENLQSTSGLTVLQKKKKERRATNMWVMGGNRLLKNWSRIEECD